MIRRILIALLLLALAPAAWGQSFPKLTGRVVDAASLLNPAQTSALTAKLEGLEKQSGRQLVVATVPDLQGYEIDDYAYRLGRTWGIGTKNKDDGTVLLVAPKERKVWIATGYGVEGTITDALAARIYRNDIIPRFRANDFPGGIDAGVDALTNLLTLPPEEAKAQAAAAAREQKEARSNGGDGAMIGFWIMLFILFFVILPFLSRARGGRRYRRGGHAPVIIWGSGSDWGSSGSSWGGGGSSWGGGDGGGFSGGGGSFGGGGAGGSW